jgi:hypothetical protein
VSVPAIEVNCRPTPILDRLRPFPKVVKRGWFSGISELIAGLIAVYVPFFALLTGKFPFFPLVREWMIRNLQNIFADDWAGVRVLLNIFLALAAIVAAIVVHEAGHVLAGSLAGFRFRYVSVGPIEMDRSFRFSRQASVENAGLGRAVFFPAEMNNRPFSCIAMTLAGPMANLISGCFVLALPFQKSVMAGAFVATSFYLGTINVLPFYTKTGMSDGLKILSILFKRRSHECRLALAQLWDQIKSGVEHEALSPALVEEATAVRGKSLLTVVAHSIAYARAYYQKNDAVAADHLETCLASSGWATPGIRYALMADAAIFQAERRHRVDLAEQWLADVPIDGATKNYRLKAEGAILQARGDFEAALLKITECIKDAESILDERKRHRSLVKLGQWKAEVEQKLTQVHTS